VVGGDEVGGANRWAQGFGVAGSWKLGRTNFSSLLFETSNGTTPVFASSGIDTVLIATLNLNFVPRT
jgi:hypothetical protein